MDMFSSPFKGKAAKVSPKSTSSGGQSRFQSEPVKSIVDTSSSTNLSGSPVSVVEGVEDQRIVPEKSRIQIVPTLLFGHYTDADATEKLHTEIGRLRATTTIFGAIASLEEISKLIPLVDPTEKPIFLQRFRKAIFCLQDTLSVSKYEQLTVLVKGILTGSFSAASIDDLPTFVLQEIFQWLTYEDAPRLATVNRYWRAASYEDVLWRVFYHRKFTLSNPNSCPTLSTVNFRSIFRKRLHDPHQGDKVEVAWRGKFRLESSDVYEGLAWWIAEVVDVHSSQGKYKIRYPGWESRWDEWVPRARFRWLVDKNRSERILKGDYVELWCCGSNVPGAWLESRVTSVRNEQYCLDRVSTAGGPMWVPRDRLRRAKLQQRDASSDETEGSLRNDANNLPLSSRGANSCSIM